jgi:ADP-heptose:LPS heptosyltransferase
MKILVVQLLRIGDIVMSVPAIQGLKEQYPEAAVHLLINRSSEKIVPIIKGVDRFHYFDRDRLQKAIGDASQSILLAHDLLAQQISECNLHDFDLVVNLTQTRLSAHICSLLQAKSKVGMHYSRNRVLRFNSFWFSQLNREEAELADGKLHFSDLFQLGSGQQSLRAANFETTLSAKSRSQPQIAIQALTSDEKKNLSREFVQGLLRQLDRKADQIQRLVFLAAPSEERELNNLLAGAELKRLEVIVEVCSFKRAIEIIEESRLMLSVDTSIKHLAGATATPVVEIALGGSDRHRTGVYQDGAIVISSQENCYPCSHSRRCPYSSRHCEQSLSSEAVAEVVNARLNDTALVESDCVKASGMRFEQVGIDGFGLWYLKPLFGHDLDQLFEIQMARAKAQLKASEQSGLFGPQVGHLSFLMKEFWRDEFSIQVRQRFHEYLLERQKLSTEECQLTAHRLFDLERQSPSLLSSVGSVVHITEQKRETFELRGALKRATSELKLIQNLDQQMMEIS